MNQQVSKLARFLGYLIDCVVFAVPVFVIAGIGLAIESALVIKLADLILIILLLLRDAMFVQTIGKKVMKYKVVKENGSSLKGDYKTSFTRNISLIIPLVDCIMVLIDKPRLGDDWAKTKVVNK